LPFQLQQLVNSHTELWPLDCDLSTFQLELTVTVSPKSSAIVQPLIWLLPLLVTAISAWKLLPQPLVAVTAQVTSPPPDELLELLLEDELEELLEDELELLLEFEELLDEELLELEELLEDELELDDELELLSPLQVGRLKLPSCVPWIPKVVL
jgi:hypothetical protein